MRWDDAVDRRQIGLFRQKPSFIGGTPLAVTGLGPYLDDNGDSCNLSRKYRLIRWTEEDTQ
jgi:hypothetical protein